MTGAPPAVLAVDLGPGVRAGFTVASPGDAPPGVGKPFQVEGVFLSSGWKVDEPFAIEWSVSGDENEIDHYDVSLRIVRPDQAQVYFTHVLHDAAVPKGQRKYVGTPDAGLVAARRSAVHRTA